MVTSQLNKPGALARAEETRPIAFFEAVYQTFQRAEQVAGGSVDCFYTIGGYTIQLRFAGPALLPFITPPLEHLAAEPNPAPALTICLWDNASTGTTLPPLPWAPNDHIARGEIRGYNDGRIYTALYVGVNMLNMLDIERDLALYCIRDASQFPPYQKGSPLLTILHWWVRNHGLQYVHAAAVGTPTRGGVLLVGKGGSGKSTTALACLNSELLYVSDDYCLLATDPIPYAYSLYNSAKLDTNHIQRFPHLVPAISNADHLDTEKALIFLHRHYPEKIVKGFPIRALLVPRVIARPETRLTPASPIAGLKAFAPSTIFQLSGASNAAFRTMTEFVKRVPCYHLELGTNLRRIPKVILDLLSDG